MDPRRAAANPEFWADRFAHRARRVDRLRCDVESVFTRDQLLANISLYWFTGAIGSSFYPYYFRRRRLWMIPDGGAVTSPTGCAEFPREMLRPPRSLAEKMFVDLRRWTVTSKGGQFAAMEQPEALTNEIGAFFRPMRV